MSLRKPLYPPLDDSVLFRAFRESSDAWRRLVDGVPWLDGVLLEDEDGAASAGVISFAHGLNRVPRGFMIADWMGPTGSSANISIYRRDGDKLTDKVIELYVTDAFESLKIWVW